MQHLSCPPTPPRPLSPAELIFPGNDERLDERRWSRASSATRSCRAYCRTFDTDPQVLPISLACLSTRATSKHIARIGIRALEQNASGVVADAASGEEIVITDRGRPVARLTGLPRSRLQFLLDAGLARPARRDIADPSASEPGGELSEALVDQREGERY